MVFMNRKEGTGVRARYDLTANARSKEPPSSRLTDAEVITGAQWLMSQLRNAEAHGWTTIPVPIEYTRRLVDTMLEVANRGERP